MGINQIAAVNSEGTFTAALDHTVDPTNDGKGVVAALEPRFATSADGVAAVTLDGVNNDFVVRAAVPGPDFADVDVVLAHKVAKNDKAIITFDAKARTLTVDIDPKATKANTVVKAINDEKTFIAELDSGTDSQPPGARRRP